MNTHGEGVGLRVHPFDDGSLGIMLTENRGAMQLNPAQAAALAAFLRARETRAPARTVLSEAGAIVYGDREATHGEPGRNLAAIAAMWGPIFGTAVEPQQVVLAMIALKVARAINNPAHRDHWVDIVGYVALAERCGFVAPAPIPAAP